MTVVRDSDLVSLRKSAEELAKGRGERPTTGHLLAAIASQPGGAADLLIERRLDAEVLLKAARVLTDDHSDALSRALQRARDLAARSPARETTAMHLLFALCQERTTAAYRAVEQCGYDVAKLRMAAMQIAMGIAGPRRTPAMQLSLRSARNPMPARSQPRAPDAGSASASLSGSAPGPVPGSGSVSLSASGSASTSLRSRRHRPSPSHPHARCPRAA